MITDPRYMPRVLQVTARAGHRLLVFFDDGSEAEIDALPLLQGEVFRPLLDENVFREKLTVIQHTVAWDLQGDRDPSRCLDLDPLLLYRAAWQDKPAT